LIASISAIRCRNSAAEFFPGLHADIPQEGPRYLPADYRGTRIDMFC
jgi:hypothetical protein